MAETISNLPIETSSRYAKDRAISEEPLFQEARGIPPQTQIDVTAPSYPSEFDQLLELEKQRLPWASIQAPAGYFEQQRGLFGELTIPRLGSIEKRESQLQKVTQMGKSGNEHDTQVITKLLTDLNELDRTKIEIYSALLQYQRG